VVELLVVMVCLACLAALVLSGRVRMRTRGSRLSCANNIKQIWIAFHSWSADNHDCLPMQVSVTNGGTMELVASGSVYPHFLVMSNELTTPKLLRCPEDKGRPFASTWTPGLTDVNVSYFLNLDAVNGGGTSLLLGDGNITNRPPEGGRTVALARGSTIAWTSTLHSGKGYLGFGDGHVGWFTNGSVATAVRIPVGATNHLAVPPQ
jgi:hypothetical protein